MKITVTQLREIIKEAVLLEVAKMGIPKRDPFQKAPAAAAPEKRVSNAQAICMVLAKMGPSTRNQITAALGRGEVPNPGAKAPDKMGAYFANISPFSKAYSNNISLISSGHIKAVDRDGAEIIYDLTPKGRRLAAGEGI